MKRETNLKVELLDFDLKCYDVIDLNQVDVDFDSESLDLVDQALILLSKADIFIDPEELGGVRVFVMYSEFSWNKENSSGINAVKAK